MDQTPFGMSFKCSVTQSVCIDVWKQFKIVHDLFLHWGTMHVVMPFIQTAGTIAFISENIRNLIRRLGNVFPTSISYAYPDLLVAFVRSVPKRAILEVINLWSHSCPAPTALLNCDCKVVATRRLCVTVTYSYN